MEWYTFFGVIIVFLIIIHFIFESSKSTMISDEEANALLESKKYLTEEEVNNLLNKYR